MNSTIHRKGTFRIPPALQSKNQCGKPAHDGDYFYSVSITINSTQLDINSFIIDHWDIDSYFQGLGRKHPMPSCEVATLRAIDYLVTLFKRRGIVPVRVIVAVGASEFARIESEWVPI